MTSLCAIEPLTKAVQEEGRQLGAQKLLLQLGGLLGGCLNLEEIDFLPSFNAIYYLNGGREEDEEGYGTTTHQSLIV